MARNLDRLGGLLLSENVMLALAQKIGRQHAHEMLYEICMGAVETQAPLKRLLLTDPLVAAHLIERQGGRAFDPARYTGLPLGPPRHGFRRPRYRVKRSSGDAGLTTAGRPLLRYARRPARRSRLTPALPDIAARA